MAEPPIPIDARTKLVALLGHPVEHSRSPLIHNTAFRVQGLNWAYVATPVVPGQVGAAVEGLKALGFAGANVTIPHKQAILPYVDELSAQARAVGAVNTLVLRRRGDGRTTVYGDNTDVAGFLDPLAPHTGALQGAPVLLFGAGGAARAVVYALLTAFQPDRFYIAARHLEKAVALARDLAPYDGRGALLPIALAGAGSAVAASRLLVNATPLGMHPYEASTPWDRPDLFSQGQVVYDLVYNPEQTRLLREAGARGATTLGGLDMLVAQAAAAYLQWTGHALPTDAVRAVLRAV
jgi:shikimate dehydrogenase